MADEQLSIFDILIETHLGLERQGPGSPEMTTKALSFLGDLDEISQVADLGCGTGGQTMILAQKIAGNITGVDMCADFIDVLNNNSKKLNLQDRVSGVVGNIEELPFQKEELDLIWSEGVVDSIGFGKGLSYWNGFLKEGGYIAVTCPSWLTDERPAEIEKFWADADEALDTVEDNISTMQKSGYSYITSFVLPEECWTDNYFIPRDAAGKALLEKYPGNETVETYLEGDKYEMELYSKYNQYYGYVFYIGKKQ